MSRKLPPVETRFKKGQSGNPTGANQFTKEMRAVRRLAAAEVAEIGTLIVSKNATKLKAILSDAKNNPESKHSALKVWMAAIALKGITKGDPNAMDVLLNRVVGRVKEKIELTGEEGGPLRHLVGAMTPEERQAELRRLRKMRSDAGDD